jgi:hypothetical protein
MLLQVGAKPASAQPVSIFYAYSHKDEALKERLDAHLAILRRQGFISTWHDRKIGPGQEWAQEIYEQLDSADLILILISANFIASDYCYDREMKRALERHTARKARVIPIILKPVLWRIAQFARLQALPRDGKPIVLWRNQEEALADVAEGIRRAIASVGVSDRQPGPVYAELGVHPLREG